MTQTARASRYRAAWGKQVAEGTAQATPAFEANIYDGSIEPTKTENPHDVADANDIPVGYWIETLGAMSDLVLTTDVDSAGFWPALHLGSDTVTGTTPKLHTIIKADTKAYVTLYHMRPAIVGGTDVWSRMVDAFIAAWEIRGSKGQPLQTAISAIGKTLELSVTAPTPGADKRILGPTPVNLQSMIGATLKIDLATTPGATTVHNIDNVVFRSEYPNANFVQTDAITGTYLDLGEWSCAFSADVVVQDYQAYAATYWGTPTVAGATLPGMALSPVIVYGSIDLTFPSAPAASANRLFQIQGPAMRLEMQPPKMDKSGSALKATITGKPFKPATGEVLTVLVSNATASY